MSVGQTQRQHARTWPLKFDWRGMSLRLQVALGSAAFLVGVVGLTGYLLVRQSEERVYEAVRQEEMHEVAQLAALLSQDMVKRQRMLALAAADLPSDLRVSEATALSFLKGHSALLASYSSVFLSRPDGQILGLRDAEGARAVPISMADRSYFQTVVKDGRPVISDVIDSKSAAGPVVVFCQPVLQTGKLVAVLGASLRLHQRSVLNDVVGDGPGGHDEGIQLIVSDSQGKILAHADPAWLLRDIGREPTINEAWLSWQGMGAPIESSGIGLNARNHVVSVAGVDATGWLLWRVRPRDMIAAPLVQARAKVFWWVMGLSLVGCLGLVAWISRIFRPLNALAERARHLFDGDPAVRDTWPSYSGEVGHLAHVLHHVAAERAQLEAFNEEILAKLQSVMNAAPVGIAFTRHQRFELVSAEFCRLFGYPAEGLGGRQAQVIFASNEDYASLGTIIPEAFANAGTYAGEWRMLRADGTVFWGQLRGRPVHVSDPNQGTIWSVLDVSQQVSYREDLEWSASHDVLTGLGNRKMFKRLAQRLIDTRSQDRPAALLAIDLDHFKPVNDTAGHAAGDAMLRGIAAVIAGCVRNGDLVARMGGDEFAVVLENCGDAAAVKIAEKIRNAVREHVLIWEGRTLAVGASVGIAMLCDDLETSDAWHATADAACYSAKQTGRTQPGEAAA